CHYGRWARRSDHWIWVPDSVWGPAWVECRRTAEDVGWAPLAPAGWAIPTAGWGFVQPSGLFQPNVSRLIVQVNITVVLASAQRIDRWVRVPGAVYPAGPSNDWMRRWNVDVRVQNPSWRDVGRFERAERERLRAEWRRRDEDRRRAEEARRRAEEERRRVEEARRAEEAKRAEEARRRQEQERWRQEEARLREERRRAEEARRADEARRAEEARRAAEEARRLEEARKVEE